MKTENVAVCTSATTHLNPLPTVSRFAAFLQSSAASPYSDRLAQALVKL
jgi:hypothetical protein